MQYTLSYHKKHQYSAQKHHNAEDFCSIIIERVIKSLAISYSGTS